MVVSLWLFFCVLIVTNIAQAESEESDCLTLTASHGRDAKVLVNSACGNFGRRAALRRTWLGGFGVGGNEEGNNLKGHGGHVEVRFIVGTGCGDEATEAENNENNGDTLVVPIVDEYRNNILKLMHSLDVFHGGIEEFDYLVKLDDDSYVDMDALLEVLNASPRLSHYRGLFFTGKPYRDPSHKNYVSPKCLPLPVLPPFAYGGGFVLSWDLVDYVVNNHRVLEKGLIRDKDGDRCCDLDDLQVGLWMFALGVELVHEDRFNGLLNCHRDTIILYDVPEWLMLEVHEGVKKGGVCNDAIHEYLLGSSKPEHVAVGLIRLILLRRWNLALERAEFESGGGETSRNAKVLLPLIRRCVGVGGDKNELGVLECDRIVEIVNESIRKVTSKIQTPRVETAIVEENFNHIITIN